MSLFQSLLFWLLTMTGNIHPCDTEVPIESETSTCTDQSESNEYWQLKWTSPRQPSDGISNGF